MNNFTDTKYRQVSNIRRNLVGNKIVDRCSWSIACRRCSNYIFILDLTPSFNGLGKDNYKMRRETCKFWELVRLILETLRNVRSFHICFATKRLYTSQAFNTLRPRQNGRHFADDIFKCIFLNENVWISIKISLKFVPKGPINNIPALVQIMAWHCPGNKPLSEAMVVNLPTHICVSRPQWDKIFGSRTLLFQKQHITSNLNSFHRHAHY